jgi:hypothetical protein
MDVTIYGECAGTVKKAVNYWLRRFPGLDQEDLLSEVNLAYAKALATHDATKSKFNTWFTHNIQQTLTHFIYRNVRRRSKISSLPTNFDVTEIPCKDSEPFSEDVRSIVSVIMDTGLTTKTSIKNHLLSIGWSINRVKESFSEIRQALGLVG